MVKDLYNQLLSVASLAPVVQPQAALVQPAAVDLLGFNAALVVISTGASGDTIDESNFYEVTLQESDDNVTYNDVDASDLLGADSEVIATVNGVDMDEDSVKLVQYKGGKRYIKAVLSETGDNTNGTVIGVTVVKARPESASVH